MTTVEKPIDFREYTLIVYSLNNEPLVLMHTSGQYLKPGQKKARRANAPSLKTDFRHVLEIRPTWTPAACYTCIFIYTCTGPNPPKRVLTRPLCLLLLGCRYRRAHKNGPAEQNDVKRVPTAVDVSWLSQAMTSIQTLLYICTHMYIAILE